MTAFHESVMRPGLVASGATAVTTGSSTCLSAQSPRPSTEYPLSQIVQVWSDAVVQRVAVQCDSAPQAVQTVSPSAVQAVAVREPSLQVEQAVQELAFDEVEKLPSAQGEQSLSRVASGASDTYAPALQLLHAPHADALTVDVKEPASQTAHSRS